MADVFQEVDEMMKQERLEKFWKENGIWIIAFVVLTILGTAAISGYKSWNNSVKEKQTTALIAMLDDPEFPANIQQDNVQELRPSLRAIANLSAAESYQSSGDLDKALELYSVVAQDDGISDKLRHVGVVMTARLDDTKTADEKLEALQNIYMNVDSPWRYHAYMESALIQAHKKNDYDAARQLLANIAAAQKAPATMKEKALKLDHVYKVKASLNTNTEKGEGS